MGLPAFLRAARAFLRRAFAFFTLPPLGFPLVAFFAVFFAARFACLFTFDLLGAGLPCAWRFISFFVAFLSAFFTAFLIIAFALLRDTGLPFAAAFAIFFLAA